MNLSRDGAGKHKISEMLSQNTYNTIKHKKQSNSIIMTLQTQTWQVKYVGWKGGQWAWGSCPTLDLQMLAHPVLLVAK